MRLPRFARRGLARLEAARAADAEVAELRSRLAGVEKRCAEACRSRAENEVAHAAAEVGWRVRERGLQREVDTLKAALSTKTTLLAEWHELAADLMRRGGAFEVDKVASHKG